MTNMRSDHHSVQVSESTMILTGGQGTDSLVTEYSNLGSMEEVPSPTWPNSTQLEQFLKGDCQPPAESHQPTPPPCMWLGCHC